MNRWQRFGFCVFFLGVAGIASGNNSAIATVIAGAMIFIIDPQPRTRGVANLKPDVLMTAQSDTELFGWLQMAQRFGGSFVRAIATAGIHADEGNYRILRPVLLQMAAKYQSIPF